MESQECHSKFQGIIQNSTLISVLKKLPDVILQHLKSQVLLLYFSTSQQWYFHLPLPENKKEISTENEWETCLTEVTSAKNLDLRL